MDLSQIYSLYRRILSDILCVIINITWSIYILSALGIINFELDILVENLKELNLDYLVIFLLIFLLTPAGLLINAVSYFFLVPIIYRLSYYFFKMNIFQPKNNELEFIVKKISFKDYRNFLDELVIFNKLFNSYKFASLEYAAGMYILLRTFVLFNLIYLILSINNIKIFLLLLSFIIVSLLIDVLIFNYRISELFSSMKIKYICNEDKNFQIKLERFMKQFGINIKNILKIN